jgi:multiple sugar transport system substrate-binding protein
MTRYWEASPSEIVLPAVEEFNRFMTNPSQEAAETAMKNIDAIASPYWAAR